MTQELNSLLKSGTVTRPDCDGDERTEWYPPVATPDQKQQIAAILRDYDNYLTPARAEWITARVVALRAHFYVADMPKQMHKAMLQDWLNALDEFPKWAIEAACNTWINGHEDKRPTPGAIRKLAAAAVVDDVETRDRLRATLDFQPPENPLLLKLRGAMSQGELTAWVKPLRVSVIDDQALVRAPTVFHRDWIKNRLGHLIARALAPAHPVYLGPKEPAPRRGGGQGVSSERLSAMVKELTATKATPLYDDERMHHAEKERHRVSSKKRAAE